MNTFKLKLYRHTNLKELFGAIFGMVIILGVSSLTYHSIVAGWNTHQSEALQASLPDSFFVYYEVEPTQQTFPVGTSPSFYFTKEYFFAGSISGKNVLRCDGFRSEVFNAEGHISEADIKLLTTGNPFVFSGNLPNFETSCTLRSIITLCEARYNVCKTQATESTPFKFTNN